MKLVVEIGGVCTLVGTYHVAFSVFSMALRFMVACDGLGNELVLKRSECRSLGRSLLLILEYWLGKKSIIWLISSVSIRPSCRPALTMGFRSMLVTNISSSGGIACMKKFSGVRSNQSNIANIFVNCANVSRPSVASTADNALTCCLNVYRLPGLRDSERDRAWNVTCWPLPNREKF